MERQLSETANADPHDGLRLRERIVDTALAVAEERGRWSAVRLHDVADRLGIPSTRVLEHYRDLDAVADAWFQRGLVAMMAPKPAGFLEEPPWRRIEICLLAWFGALSPYRRVSAQMLRGKLHPSHPHHWVPMVFSLSRTIQWLREAAHLEAEYGTRAAEREEVRSHRPIPRCSPRLDGGRQRRPGAHEAVPARRAEAAVVTRFRCAGRKLRS